MKTKLILSSLSFFLAVSISQSSKGSETRDERQTRNATEFHGISVSNGIDVYMEQKNQEQVVVEADADIIDRVVTTVEGGILKVYMKNKSGFDLSLNTKTTKVFVSFKNIDKISASSGSDVSSKSLLKLGSIDIDASSASDINLELEAVDVAVESSSGSDVSLKGKAETLRVNASSASDVKASELQAKKCSATASSGSDVHVCATEELNANASSAADITYSGNPKRKDINESSAGDVSGR